VLGLDGDADAVLLQSLLDPVGDLRRQAFLYLQVTREAVDDPTELGEADDPLGRQVGDVRDAVERQQVMSAQRLEGDVPDQDELVVALPIRKGSGAERAPASAARHRPGQPFAASGAGGRNQPRRRGR
jgi:hypothetical protein